MTKKHRTDEKLTAENVVELVEREGLSYTIQTTAPSRIADPELRAMWVEADIILDQIQVYLDVHNMGSSDQDDEEGDDNDS